MTRVLPPLYQLAVAPDGSWRARVFNLPVYLPGKVPTLPFLRQVVARPAGAVSNWHKDPAEQLTVLRLAGPSQASLTVLLRRLAIYGINRVRAYPPT